MSADRDVSERHLESLPVLEEMIGWRKELTTAGSQQAINHSVKQLLLGLCDDSRIWALATAEIHAGRQLVIRHIAVHPVEINLAGSTAALRLMRGLRALASIINVQLIIDDLKDINKGRFWLTGLALLSMPSDNDGDEGHNAGEGMLWED